MPRRLLTSLYFHVIVAVVAGALLGHFAPHIGQQMNPLGAGFIKLIRMVVAPIVFVTVSVGIARLRNAGEVGRIAVKALVYFEVLTTLAMVIGLVVCHVIQPGDGMNVDRATLDPASIASYTTRASHQSMTAFLLNIIPSTLADAFVTGDMLQVVLVAVLFGIALAQIGDRGRAMVQMIDDLGATLFRIVAVLMRAAPLGAFGAMAFAIGRYGIGALYQLGMLIACFYITLAVFIIGGLGLVLRITGLRLWPLVKYIKDEFIIVVACSTTEPVLPSLMAKLEALGCARPLVGLTLPLGYAFNLDGTSMYFTMAITFIAQALNIHLSWGDYATILAVLLIASKGAATAPGAGFVTLAATLSVLGSKVPVEGILLILGIDRFMSEARGIGNLFGNTVATIFVAWWEDALDVDRARRVLSGRHHASEPFDVLTGEATRMTPSPRARTAAVRGPSQA